MRLDRIGRMTATAKRWLLAVVLLPLAAAGCADGVGTEIATVSLALTDNPGDVDSVWVEIGEIYLQGGPQGRVPLLSEADADALGLVELTQLAGTTLDLVSDVAIAAGNYGQLRLVVDGAVLETEDGDVFTFNAAHPHGLPATGSLRCPSCDQTGIKVLLPGAVADLEAGAHLIVLDFDVSQSFGREAGMSGSWVMHPVILGAEVGFTGAVGGTVDVARDGSGNPLVAIPECPAGTERDITAFVPLAVAQTLTDDLGDPLRLTSAVQASDSSFTFPFLTPDAYDMTFVTKIGFGDDTITFAADAPGIVDVTAGANLALTYTITSAVCG
jgi:hypothetical protein